MTRCIAMGRGSKENPHFHFVDIDRKLDFGELETLLHKVPSALVYSTTRGYHILQSDPFPEGFIGQYGDVNCLHSAVRIYPYRDYNLIQCPLRFCIRAAKIYEMIFKIRWKLPREDYFDCTKQALKFGVYNTNHDKGVNWIGEPKL